MANTTKANPIRWLWDRARNVYQRLRGENVEKITEATPNLRDRFLVVEQRTGWLNGLSEELVNGDISIQRWVLRFRDRLKDAYINEYMLARGGRSAMTQRDWGRLGRMLRDQYGYLDRFAQDVAAGRLSKDQIQARSEMYFKSARQAYERGHEEALGMPTLPAYPGDGSTVCLSNCQCHWDVRQTEDEWLATWTLGAAEHCPDCIERANRWAPLRFPKT
jgi:hypothetical protein